MSAIHNNSNFFIMKNETNNENNNDNKMKIVITNIYKENTSLTYLIDQLDGIEKGNCDGYNQ